MSTLYYDLYLKESKLLLFEFMHLKELINNYTLTSTIKNIIPVD